MRNKIEWLDVLLVLVVLLAVLVFADPLAVLEMDRPNPTPSAAAR